MSVHRCFLVIETVGIIGIFLSIIKFKDITYNTDVRLIVNDTAKNVPITLTTWLPIYPTTHRRTHSKHKIWIPGTVEYFKDVRSQCFIEERWLRHKGVDNLCDCIPQGIPQRIRNVNVTLLLSLSWPEAENSIINLLPGGHSIPLECTPRRRVIIVVPFRDRESHLRAFLAHHHKIWQMQKIEYMVFVLEQHKPSIFNKAALMNIGFLEARKIFPADCVVFHDVDLLVETNGNILTCWKHPIHLTPFIDKFRYKLPYKYIYGGAVSLQLETFLAVNGYSNTYYGWGGEDDDMASRLRAKRYKIYRGPLEIARYTTLRHHTDIGNPAADGSYRGFSIRRQQFKTDGINAQNLKYDVLSMIKNPLYTWIHINIIDPKPPENKIEVKHREYILLKADCITNTSMDTTFIDINTTTLSTDEEEDVYYYVSRITCTGICDSEESCIGFSYHSSNITDSYCQLYTKSDCLKTEAKENVELHVDINYYRYLFYT